MVKPENLAVVDADGSTCFACGEPMAVSQNKKMIEVTFKVIVSVKKAVHVSCAAEIRDLIDLRVSQANGRSE